MKKLFIAICLLVNCTKAKSNDLVYEVITPDVKWHGTGFLVKTKKGIRVITNRHVCGDYKELILMGNYTKIAHVSKVSKFHDLCLLESEEIETDGYEVFTKYLEDDLITVPGYPDDHGYILDQGTVGKTSIAAIRNHLDKSDCLPPHRFDEDEEVCFDFYVGTKLFTSQIEGGSSGSPVLNKSGQVIGVILASKGNEFSLMIPGAFLKEFLEE